MPQSREERTANSEAFKAPLILEASAIKDHAHTIDCTGIDISHGGVGLKTGQSLEEGAIVKVSVPISDLNVTRPIFAEVIWSKKETGGFTMGLRLQG